jgi:hypothetical protein
MLQEAAAVRRRRRFRAPGVIALLGRAYGAERPGMRAGPGGAAGLGGDFAKLWTANAVSNLGDGVTRVAAPLLMASLTGDPALVAGAVRVPAVYIALFLLGVGGTLADNASFALLPAIVPAAGLARANARLMAGYLVANQLAGGPLGAGLFVVAAPLPFGFDAASFVAGAGLIAAAAWRRFAPAALAARAG